MVSNESLCEIDHDMHITQRPTLTVKDQLELDILYYIAVKLFNMRKSPVRVVSWTSGRGPLTLYPNRPLKHSSQKPTPTMLPRTLYHMNDLEYECAFSGKSYGSMV